MEDAKQGAVLVLAKVYEELANRFGKMDSLFIRRLEVGQVKYVVFGCQTPGLKGLGQRSMTFIMAFANEATEEEFKRLGDFFRTCAYETNGFAEMGSRKKIAKHFAQRDDVSIFKTCHGGKVVIWDRVLLLVPKNVVRPESSTWSQEMRRVAKRFFRALGGKGPRWDRTYYNYRMPAISHGEFSRCELGIMKVESRSEKKENFADSSSSDMSTEDGECVEENSEREVEESEESELR